MPNPLILAGLIGAGFYYLNKSKSKTTSKISQTPQDSGIIITNCSSIKFTNKEKFIKYLEKTFNDSIKSKQIYDLDYTDLETLNLIIETVYKKIAPSCYDLFKKRSYKTKEQMLTSVIIFLLIWNQYIKTFLDDGVSNPKLWEKNFASQQDFQIWLGSILSNFDKSIHEDFIKFKLSLDNVIEEVYKIIGKDLAHSSLDNPDNFSKLQINDITEETFQKLVIEGSIDENVLVDFYANWCVICKPLNEMLTTLPFDFIEKGKTRFYKLDIDANPNLKAAYNVEAIPYLVIFKNGLVIGTFKGLPNNKDILMSWITNPTISS